MSGAGLIDRQAAAALSRFVSTNTQTPPPPPDETPVLDWLLFVARHAKLLIAGSVLAGAAGLGASYLVPPTYSARATLLPPQQQSTAASALSALSGLSGLAGGALGVRSPADQYITLMRSARVADRMIEAFDLEKVYEAKTRTAARRALEANTRLGTTRKETLITVEVDDVDPARAAAMANRYIEELRVLSGQLALTEAQQRRTFFERELVATKERLSAAQRALQGSGFNPGALRAEPRSAAESYARLKADLTKAEIQLAAMRLSFTDEMPEVRRQQALVEALRAQLAQLESSIRPGDESTDYIGRYREYKYQETLFEVFSRQFETARLDESREATLIQVVDQATPPELRSHPKRRVIAQLCAATAFLLGLVALSLKHFASQALRDPVVAARLGRAGRPFGRRT